jgi:hypothetical protein
MEEQTSELDGWLDIFRDAIQKVGGEHRPGQTVGAGLSVRDRLLRWHELAKNGEREAGRRLNVRVGDSSSDDEDGSGGGADEAGATTDDGASTPRKKGRPGAGDVRLNRAEKADADAVFVRLGEQVLSSVGSGQLHRHALESSKAGFKCSVPAAIVARSRMKLTVVEGAVVRPLGSSGVDRVHAS